MTTVQQIADQQNVVGDSVNGQLQGLLETVSSIDGKTVDPELHESAQVALQQIADNTRMIPSIQERVSNAGVLVSSISAVLSGGRQTADGNNGGVGVAVPAASTVKGV